MSEFSVSALPIARIIDSEVNSSPIVVSVAETAANLIFPTRALDYITSFYQRITRSDISAKVGIEGFFVDKSVGDGDSDKSLVKTNLMAIGIFGGAAVGAIIGTIVAIRKDSETAIYEGAVIGLIVGGILAGLIDPYIN